MKRITCVLALLAPCATPRALAQETDPAEWVPADAIVYIGITDSEKLVEDFKKTNVYAQIEAAASGGDESGSANALHKWIDRFKTRLAEALDMPGEDVKNPFGGAVAIYVTAPHGGGPDDVVPGLVAGVRDQALMKRYYEAAVRKLRDYSDEHESVSAGSNTIDVFTNRADEDEGDVDEFDEFDDGGMPLDENALDAFMQERLDELFDPESLPKKFAVCLTEDRLIVADSPETVKNVLRRDRSGESLASSDLNKALARQFKPLGPLRVVVNLPRVWSMIAKEDEEAAKWLDILGTRSMQAVIAHLHLGGEYDYKTEAMVLMSGERTGLAKIFSMENRPLTPPGTVSADAAVYGSLNLNILTLLDEIERMIRKNDPAAADEMRAGMESVPLGPENSMNLRKDLLEHLREPLSMSLVFGQPYGVDTVRLLVTLGHRNREAMEKFLGAVQPYLTARDVGGTQVYDAMMGGLAVSPTNDTLLIGTRPAVEAGIQARSDSGLAENAVFRRVEKLAPKEASAAFYVDNRRFMQASIAFLEQREQLMDGGMPTAGAGIAMMMVEQLVQQLGSDDPEKARALLKYQAPGIATLSTETDGVRLIQVTLRPE